MNGCHSTLHPNRCQHKLVWHSKGKAAWPFVFNKDCQYIKQKDINDSGCDGCKEKEKK